ncbi:penicillin-binding protein 2 [Daejeonella rubra]|uniref:Penicillin-binding protein 2 n=1 Tax=Daejeonella rubra TaxID=990371 RepID=A0A1G9T9T7_9SPHI|nr:penicillin-binding protein 2 [Daejeonella rubra]SDM44411.1 penicillin-binding protein 2 [Daejeonella rubra]
MNSFFARKFVVQGIFIAIIAILLARLFYIQVISDEYILSAENNVIRRLPIYPARGVILDRYEKILVQNEPVYDLMVIPREVKAFDTLEFCKLIGIDKAGFDRRFKKARNYSPYKASIFEKQLSVQIYASFQEKLTNFPGFFVQNRTVRRYPDSIAAHFLGYIGEVNQKVIEKSNGFYSQGDYHGITGIEKSYEELLRGQRGVQNLMVDALNRPKGNYAGGKYDTVAVSGEHMMSSLDKDLQKFGEQLMQNKIGSIVAIEPSTGEILSFVSSPGYDPNLMVGRQRGNNYMALLNDKYKPMFVRPIQAEYPPGSIFKVVNALVAQQFGLINENTYFFCPGGYRYGRRGYMGCTHVHGSVNLKSSITESCNTYYGYTYSRMIDFAGMRPVNAFKKWRNAVSSFGIGTALGIDLPGERNGLLPTDELYTKRFKNDRWGSAYTISLSIGQGELGITPLQMANVMAIVANRGFFYKPHLIKAIGDKKVIKEEYLKKNNAGIDSKYFDVVIDGMSAVVNQPSGTAWYSKIIDIEMCGKTGTVQNPHGKDHSVFVAFAPRDNPKIAIAVVVENAGFGATWSAPIASLMVEKYIKKTISRPQAYVDRLLQANLLPGAVGNSPSVKKPVTDSTSNNTKKPNKANRVISNNE